MLFIAYLMISILKPKSYENEYNKIYDLSSYAETLNHNEILEFTHEAKLELQHIDNSKELNLKLKEYKPKAFAIARESAKRILGKYPFKSQVLGALALNDGNIAEMNTGEGKTLTATMAVYLNALMGNSVHVITVNEYLNAFQAIEMKELYNYLGLSVGINSHDLNAYQKQEVYKNDVVYSTHSEIGFDYLKDNLVYNINHKVMRGFDYAIIDEIDSILLDEAKTPLVISDVSYENTNLYLLSKRFVKLLKPTDYEIDEISNNIYLNEEGINKAEKFFKVSNMFDIENRNLYSTIHLSLKAKHLLVRDIHYIVKENTVYIIDQNTGRLLDGRRFSHGLHQAIEVKENVKINKASITKSSITYQSLFRLYKKLSGMTGTAKNDEEEFLNVYNTKVVEIQPNKPSKRRDYDDIIFKSKIDKYNYILELVKKKHEKGQPILIGTSSISNSETISSFLSKNNISHNILNAKNHLKEANIIRESGEAYAVTIATNMAGRGTDIKVSSESLKKGGLCVIGTDKQNSKRIDDQLRGRAGRQGEVGESIFVLSLEDDLIAKNMRKELIIKKTHKIKNNKHLVKLFDNIQKTVESIDLQSRKNVLEYDEVIQNYRMNYFKLRDDILSLNNITDFMVDSIEQSYSNNDIEAEKKNEIFMKEKYLDFKKANPSFEELEKEMLLTVLDEHWADFLSNIMNVKQTIHLYTYSQRKPITAFQELSLNIYKEFINLTKERMTHIITTNI